MIERLRLLLIKLALCAAVLTLLVFGVVLLSVELYLLLSWNLSDLIEVVGGAGDVAIALYITLGLSVALILFSLLGLIGVCRRSTCCLMLFAFFLVICLLLMIAVSACFFAYRGVLETHGKTEMLDSLKIYYNGEDGKDAVSAGWNLLQFKLECCGVEDYNDWNQSTWYEGDPTVQGITQKWPFTCCSLSRSDVTEQDLIEGKVGGQSVALADVNECHLMETPGLYTKGCKDELFSLLDKSVYGTAGVALASIVVMLCLLWMTCHLIHAASEEKQKNKFMVKEHTQEVTENKTTYEEQEEDNL
ncbi:tetraspanin-7-like [Convolutriloba macropyga]|uniref:tetraspanin-7-like n=1 Tax=Convolutriloba macropyga TaxID=536237 RepID=UPI003F51D885